LGEIKKINPNEKIDKNWYLIGIDLGTTNSVISYFDFDKKRPEPIDVSQGFGKIPIPSVIQIREEGEKEWVIGEEAYKSMIIYPDTTVMSVKRKMGTTEKIQLGEDAYLPEELSAKILKTMIDQVYVLNPNAVIIGVVVSVPYDFDDAAKRATVKACQIAGIGDMLIGLIEEPKAAALYYSFMNDFVKDSNIMVFDFGGGTLDITIFNVLEVNENQVHFKVISEGGDFYHGGDYIDELILNHLLKIIYDKTGICKDTIQRENKAELYLIARDLKERLSGMNKSRVPITFAIPPFSLEISRKELEFLSEKFIEKTRQLVLKALAEGYKGKIMPNEIDRVLLEGGASSMPWVKEMLVTIFNDYEKIYASNRPALDISLGAAYYGAIKTNALEHPDILTLGHDVKFELTVPHDIGFEVDFGNKTEFYPMISRGTPYLLATKSQNFSLLGEKEENLDSLNIKILERMNKEDKLEQCHLIGEILVQGIVKRPYGKTKLKIELSIEEASGIIKGRIEDMGYPGLYEPSGLKADFSPERNKITIVRLERKE